MSPAAHLTLTQRDLAILLMAHAYQGVTVELVRRRHFASNGARSACYTRIKKLISADYLTSLRLGSTSGVGSGKAFLTLGAHGRSVVADVLGLSVSELGRSSRMHAPALIDHHLATADFHLSLELATEHSSTFRLVDWTSEVELRQAPMKVTDPLTRRPITVIPDGAFVLALPDDTEQGFRLEMDMGTIPPKRLRTKLRGYLAARVKRSTPILFAVPDELRRAAINRWTLDEAQRIDADPTIIWLALQSDVTEDTLFTQPIWQVVGGPVRLALDVVAGEETATSHQRGEHLIVAGGRR